MIKISDELVALAIENHKNGISFEESAKQLKIGDNILRRAILELWTGKEL